jgi:hypothetical protein
MGVRESRVAGPAFALNDWRRRSCSSARPGASGTGHSAATAVEMSAVLDRASSAQCPDGGVRTDRGLRRRSAQTGIIRNSLNTCP